MAKKKSTKAKAKTPKKAARKAAPRTAPKRTARTPVRKAAKAKPARKALKTKALTKKVPKKSTKKVARKVAKKVVRKAVRKPVAKRPAKASPKPKARAKATPKAKAVRAAKPAPKPKTAPQPPVPTRLLRERKRLPEVELEDQFVGMGDDARLLQSARSGHDELRSELNKHTESSLELTAGDVDANWQDAYAVGDEAPGGDSPTPDQDRVDDIGKALGVQYDDDEELMGGAEIEERDAHRWELDPKSKNDEEI
jgi:hypothetical protein